MVDNIGILFNCSLPSTDTIKALFGTIEKLNLDWTKVYIWNWSLGEESKSYQNLEDAVGDYINNINRYDISLNCTKENDDLGAYKLIVQNYGKEKNRIKLSIQIPQLHPRTVSLLRAILL